MKARFIRWLRRRICKLYGHVWTGDKSYKRYCECCSREEWLFENRNPCSEEPRYVWRVMWP